MPQERHPSAAVNRAPPPRRPAQERWLLFAAGSAFAGVVLLAIWQQLAVPPVAFRPPDAAPSRPLSNLAASEPRAASDAVVEEPATTRSVAANAPPVRAGGEPTAPREMASAEPIAPASPGPPVQAGSRSPTPPEDIRLAEDLPEDVRAADEPLADGSPPEPPADEGSAIGSTDRPADAEDDPPPDERDDESATDPLTASHSWQVAIYTPPLDTGNRRESGDLTKLKLELQGLLASGLQEEGADLDEARRRHRAALEIDRFDPRPDYALAVVLAAAAQPQAARAPLQAARDKAIGRYPPALGLLAWLSLSQGDLPEGAGAVLELVRSNLSEANDWLPADSRDTLAEWVGRLVGFAVGSDRFSARQDEAARLAETVRERLTAGAREAFDRGVSRTREACETIRRQLERPESDLAADAAQELVRLQSELETARQDSAQALAAARDELEEIESRLRETDRQFRDLTQTARIDARGLDELSDSARRLAQPRFRTERRTRMVMDRDGGRMRSEDFLVRIPETDQEREARLEERARVQERYTELQPQVVRTRLQTAALRKERDRLKNELRAAKQAREPELKRRQRRQIELATQVRYLEQNEITHASLRQKLAALQTFVPFDPQSERQFLLESLKRGR